MQGGEFVVLGAGGPGLGENLGGLAQGIILLYWNLVVFVVENIGLRLGMGHLKLYTKFLLFSLWKARCWSR